FFGWKDNPLSQLGIGGRLEYVDDSGSRFGQPTQILGVTAAVNAAFYRRHILGRLPAVEIGAKGEFRYDRLLQGSNIAASNGGSLGADAGVLSGGLILYVIGDISFFTLRSNSNHL